MVESGGTILLTGVGGNAPILRSTDEGATWATFTNFAGVDAPKDLADLKQKGDYFYLASNDGGLYRAHKDDTEWSLIRAFDGNADEEIYDILIDESSGRIYITTLAGLEYSDDDATTWTVVTAETLAIGSGIPDGLIFLGQDILLQMANGANSRMQLIPSTLGASSELNAGLDNFSSENRFLSLRSTSNAVFGIRINQNALWQFGGMTTSSVDETEQPVAFQLFQNYPNPFNPTTNIPFTLTRAGHSTIKVHNVLGQHITTLVDAFLPAGPHAVQFDTAGLPAGIYMYTLQLDNEQVTRHMTLFK